MVALIYLLLTVFLGFMLVNFYLPGLGKDIYRGQRLFPKFFLLFPAYFSVGVLFTGWVTYLLAYAFHKTGQGMRYGTTLALIGLTCAAAVTTCRHRRFIWQKLTAAAETKITAPPKESALLFLFFLLVFAFVCWLMTYTFFFSDGKINMGVTIYSDFAVHTALIRSFSVGSNFPTNFPHFPDNTMRYHFMFQFFIGVLEYLGLRIDLAMNIVSVISLFNCALLLYVFAIMLTKRKACGILTVIFFFFRSSFSGVLYIYENAPYDSPGAFLEFIKGTSSFVGRTLHEDWGLWNMNVYANQRHFAPGISILLIGLIAALPYLNAMRGQLADKRLSRRDRFWRFFAAKDAWYSKRYKSAVFLGILVGAASFFNGACTIALLAMLAVMAVFSKHRFEFVIIAVIAYCLASMEASFFAPGIVIASPDFHFGFIVEFPTISRVALYILELTGICLVVAFLTTIIKPKLFIIIFLIFAAPLLITFTLSLTPDVTVNHKYLMIAMALMNIPAAYGICLLASLKPHWSAAILSRSVAAALCVLMVLTGAIDLISEHNMNGDDHSVALPIESSYQTWIRQQTEPNDVFLTAANSVDEIFLAGRYEFLGHPYYAWSAGYDTYARFDIAKAIWESHTPEELRRLIYENQIDYIVVTPDVLNSQEWRADILNIADTFPVVYEDADALLTIYKAN